MTAERGSTAVSRPCPGCGARESRTLGEVNGFRMQGCRRCGTLFTAKLPSAADATDYAGYYHDGNLEVPSFVHRQLDQIVNGFESYRHLNRWLDVGCGAGTLLEAARRGGWDVVGTEVAESATSPLRARGLDVRSGELAELGLPERSFDVVSMVEVLEHVADLRGLLVAAARVVRPGGAVYVTTPHGRGVSGRVLGVRWSVVSPPEHLQLFSRRGLQTRIEAAGLEVSRLRTRGVNPSEILGAVRRGDRIGGGARVASSYRVNEALISSRVGRVVKAAANAALAATSLGDSITLVAERPD